MKYGREEGSIKLGFHREDRTYRLEVWNDGKGLSADKIAGLFEKFVRFGDEPETTSRGTGLGLFITKEIIAKHGGKIWVESQEGHWIAFIFTLPVDDAQGVTKAIT